MFGRIDHGFALDRLSDHPADDDIVAISRIIIGIAGRQRDWLDDPPRQAGFDADRLHRTDVGEHRRVADDAGAKLGGEDAVLEIDIIGRNDPAQRAIAEAIAGFDRLRAFRAQVWSDRIEPGLGGGERPAGGSGGEGALVLGIIGKDFTSGAEFVQRADLRQEKVLALDVAGCQAPGGDVFTRPQLDALALEAARDDEIIGDRPFVLYGELEGLGVVVVVPLGEERVRLIRQRRGARHRLARHVVKTPRLVEIIVFPPQIDLQLIGAKIGLDVAEEADPLDAIFGSAQ